jgi:exosortase
MTLLKRHALFVVYSLGLMALNVSVLRALVDLSLHDDTSSHIVLIPFIAAALMYVSRDSVFAMVQTDSVAGGAVVLVGATLLLIGRALPAGASHGSALSVAVAGFVVLWVGGFLLCYGRRAVRAALFPILFLGFMVPIPGVLLDGATWLLKTGSREAVAGLFTLTGTPYYREGFVFALPKFVIEIADECSGIRSSIALFLTSLLAGHVFLVSGSRKAVLALAALPVAILKNGIRIVGLSLLATYVNPGFLTGRLHHEGGIVFFLLALVILAPVVGMLHNSEPQLSRDNQ